MIITGEQMIGYGPDISLDTAMSNNDNDNDPDFHPLPPPITTKGTVAMVTGGWLPG